MIPQQAVVAWRKQAPWSVDSMIEQDLVISRALVELFNHPRIAESLAFRGGTALYKLHMLPSARYSEDIDLVQIRAEPIGETLDLIRRLLDAWLGTPKRVLKEGRVNLLYRFTSEDASPVPMRLKIEINTREHFAELGYHHVPFAVQSQWFSGESQITTFDFNELLGTKLRALYQRKKGRDLFDLWMALESGKLQPERLLQCFQRYMADGGHTVSRAEFEQNLYEKSQRADFRADMSVLLRPGLHWDFQRAMDRVLTDIVALLPGEPWQGVAETDAVRH